MIRRAGKVLLVGALLLSAGAAALWLLLRPPTYPVPRSDDLVFRNVTVVNPGLGRVPAQQLVVRAGRIVSIGPAGGAPPTTDSTADYSGAFLLPGLIDMHVHHPFALGFGDLQLWGLLFLAHGVTTVRDTGTLGGTILTTRRRIQAGEFPGPRIFACGPVLDGAPPAWPFARVVRTPAEGRAAVDELAEARVDCIKVYHDITPDALASVRDAAARRHLPVIGHVPLRVPLEDRPVDDVQHLMGVAPLPATNIALADWLGRWRTVDGARLAAVVRTSVTQGITHTPTLVMWDRVARMVDYQTQLADPTARLLPRWYRDVLWNYRGREYMLGDVSPGRADILASGLMKMKSLVLQLHAAGVRTHLGTDVMLPFVVPGASLLEELRLFVDAGLSPEDAGAEATRLSGQSLGQADLGTLSVGAPADFLVYREDPSRDLTALATLEAVVAQGRLYPSAVLDEALRRHRQYFESPLYDALSMAIARAAVRLLF